MWRKYFLEEAQEEQTMQSHTQWKPWITSVSSYKLHKLWQHFTSPRTFLSGGIVTLERERIFFIQHRKNTMKNSPGPLFLILREHLPLCIHVKLLRQRPIISVHQSLQVKKATHHCLGKCFHSLQRVCSTMWLSSYTENSCLDACWVIPVWKSQKAPFITL